MKAVKKNFNRRIKSISNRLLYEKLGENLDFDPINTVVVKGRDVEQLYKGILIIFTKEVVKRKVLVLLEESGREDELLVTDTLKYNINLQNEVQCIIQKENELKVATSVDISLISGPLNLSNSCINSLLENYFTKPKIVQKGDIIEVDLEKYGKDIFFSDFRRLNSLKDSVYFKCNRTDGDLCVFGNTTLTQSPNIQHFIPKKFYETSGSSQINMCPYGLEKYLNELHRSVAPFVVKKKINLKPTFLLIGSRGIGKTLLLKSLAANLGMHLFNVNSFNFSANVYAQNETKIRNIFNWAKAGAPCILSITDFENFGKNNEGHYDDRIMTYFLQEQNVFFQNNDFPVILICCSNENNLPKELKRSFLKTIHVNAPDEDERKSCLRWLKEYYEVEVNNELVNEIARKTNGFLIEDLRTLIYHSINDFHRKEEQFSRVKLEKEHLFKALDYMQQNYNDSLGAPKVPKVLWSDIGGLDDIKEEIKKTIKFPLQRCKFFKENSLKRSGILLFGPPGTGKTLIAKAVATECELCFLSVKGPELLNMYVGQSEQNIREVFEKARQASPCIIFFDELDALAPNRGRSGDSGGVMDRVVSQLLAEMDGLDQEGQIFVIGATNRPDLIDTALLRPGRFDKLLYIGPYNDPQAKLSVLKALSKRLNFNVNLEEVVQYCPYNMSGADLYSVCSNAWLLAVKKTIKNASSSGKKEDDLGQQDVIIEMEDFKEAIKCIKPSISENDMRYYNNVKKNFT